jgi:hypothetical protein
MLTREERARVIGELLELRLSYPKLEMPEAVIRQFSKPPANPGECVFALTTGVLSADFKSRVEPCHFGGTPDCTACGCMASMALAAVADHKLKGVIPVGALFRASLKIGRLWAGADAPARAQPLPRPFTILPPEAPGQKP